MMKNQGGDAPFAPGNEDLDPGIKNQGAQTPAQEPRAPGPRIQAPEGIVRVLDGRTRTSAAGAQEQRSKEVSSTLMAAAGTTFGPPSAAARTTENEAEGDLPEKEGTNAVLEGAGTAQIFEGAALKEKIQQLIFNPQLLEGVLVATRRLSSDQLKLIREGGRGASILCRSVSGSVKADAYAIGTLARIARTSILPITVKVTVVVPSPKVALRKASVFWLLSQFMTTQIMVGLGSEPGEVVRAFHDADVLITTAVGFWKLGEAFLKNADCWTLIIDDADQVLSSNFTKKLHQSAFGKVGQPSQCVVVYDKTPFVDADFKNLFLNDAQELELEEKTPADTFH